MVVDSFKLKKYKALLFDLDGTLVDSMRANFFAYRDVLELLNWELDGDSFESHWGTEADYFLPAIFPEITVLEIERIQSQKPVFFERYLGEISLNLELFEVIRSCKNSHALGLVTSSKRGSASRVIAHHKLNELFDVVVTGSDTVRRKPHPDPYLMALQQIGCSAMEALAFEDSNVGVASAEAAGIEVVKVSKFNS